MGKNLVLYDYFDGGFDLGGFAGGEVAQLSYLYFTSSSCQGEEKWRN
ncbi:MAG: hypothetical protein ACK4FL_03600 [Microgenomates group bacterium]